MGHPDSETGCFPPIDCTDVRIIKASCVGESSFKLGRRDEVD